MSAPTRITRRTALQAAIGGIALASASQLPAVTPHQTEGPFFPLKDQADKDLDMTLIQGHGEHAKGEVVEISGRVLDEAGQPVADALVDIWQANVHGRYAHERDPNPAPLDPHFQGWAQMHTDADGRFKVRTIIPGAYPVEDGWTRPPHIHFKVARRGFHELTTQMYFAGNPLNDVDRLLNAVPEAERPKLVVNFAAADDKGVRAGSFTLELRRV